MPDTSRPPLPDAAAREQIEKALGTSLLVEAAAGTGKTTGMVKRLVNLIRSGAATPAGIAAVTFTRKAAGELRSRFGVALEKAAREADGEEATRLRQGLATMDQCTMGTIHSFCASLLRERPIEAGVEIGFAELDDTDDAQLRAAVWREWADGLAREDPTHLIGRLREVGLSLAELSAAFLAFAEFPDVDEWPGGDPVPLDVPRFAVAVSDRLAALRVVQPDLPEDEKPTGFPQVVRNLLARADLLDLDHPGDCVLLMEDFPRDCPKASRGVKYDKDLLARLRTEWEEFDQAVLRPAINTLRASRYALVLEAMMTARERYDVARRERGELNFSDLLLVTARTLRERPEVRGYFQRRISHLLVDEFQDTDPVQAEIMMLLTADDPATSDWTACRPRPGSLFVVGDPKQSIYRFRRADIVTYAKVKRIIAEAPGGEVLTLSTNFRCAAPVVAWVNETFAPQFPETADEVAPAYVPLDVGRSEVAVGDLDGVWTLPDRTGGSAAEIVQADADSVARFIRHAVATGKTVTRSENEIRDGRDPAARYDDFLVVPLNTRHLATYAGALRALGVPCRVSGGCLLGAVDAVHHLVRCLGALAAPHDPLALVGVLRSELFGVSDPELYAFRQAGGEFDLRTRVPAAPDGVSLDAVAQAFACLQRYAGWLRVLPPATAVERIVADTGLLALACTVPGGDVASGALCKAVEILRDGQAGHWSLAAILGRLNDLIEGEAGKKHDAPSVRESDEPAVRIMNLHKVKGLEAPVVFLANPTGYKKHAPNVHIDRSGSTTRGALVVSKPLGRFGQKTLAHPQEWGAMAEREQAFLDAETMRLLYVAATRAGSMLVVSTREKRVNDSPWALLQPALAKAQPLAVPPPEAVSAETRTEAPLAVPELKTRLAESESALADLTEPTRRVVGAKTYALSTAEAAEPAPEIDLSVTPGEAPHADWSAHGAEWGEVIHTLLETTELAEVGGLEARARTLLVEHGMDPARAVDAALIARGALDSPLMQRARAASRCLLEVPFHVCLQGVLVRGAVDLAFQEEAGWVLVDHKTDDTSRTGTDTLARHYAPQLRLYADAWQAVTGQAPVELLLNFVRSGEVASIPVKA